MLLPGAERARLLSQAAVRWGQRGAACEPLTGWRSELGGSESGLVLLLHPRTQWVSPPPLAGMSHVPERDSVHPSAPAGSPPPRNVRGRGRGLEELVCVCTCVETLLVASPGRAHVLVSNGWQSNIAQRGGRQLPGHHVAGMEWLPDGRVPPRMLREGSKASLGCFTAAWRERHTHSESACREKVFAELPAKPGPVWLWSLLVPIRHTF